MKGSEFIKAAWNMNGSQRTALALKCLREGSFVRWTFYPVRIGNYEIKAAEDVFAIGEDRSDIFRVPMTGELAQTIADELNLRIPTRRMVDLIHARAVHKIVTDPLPAPWDWTMDTMSRIAPFDAETTRRVDMSLKLRPQNGIRSGHRKVIIASASTPRGMETIYGWFRADGTPRQEVNSWHHWKYSDYSHGGLFVDPVVYDILNSTTVTLDELLRSPLTAPLFSAEGPLNTRILSEGDMKRGDQGSNVTDWQSFLRSAGFVLSVDGKFGPETERVTRLFQKDKGVPETGIVDVPTRDAAKAIPLSSLDTRKLPLASKTIQARNYSKAGRPTVDLIVIHTMEAPEKPKTAEAVAKWFAGPNAPKASAHYCVDDQEVVSCVDDADVAWHAPGANHNGIGIEHAGYASQTPEQWADEYTRRMLTISARLIARLCDRWSIPIVKLSPEQLAVKGARGIVGHDDCTKAFKTKGGHTDPGKNFPWVEFIEQIRKSV